MNYSLTLWIFTMLWHFVASQKSAAYCPELITKEVSEPTGIIKGLHRGTTERVTLYIPLVSTINLYRIEKKKLKFEVVKKCCKGYSMNGLGVCEPLCVNKSCGEFEMCIEPDKCGCKIGYSAALSEDNTNCLPICDGGCEPNAHCQAPNQCACNEGFISSRVKTEAGVFGIQCRRRCRTGADWDPLTLICVERREVNVTVIAAELNLLMAGFKPNQPDEIESDAVAKLEAFISDKNSTATNSATEAPNCKIASCLNLIHASIGFGLTTALLILGSILLYMLKRRQQRNSDVILEGKNNLCDECFLDRSQILVY